MTLRSGRRQIWDEDEDEGSSMFEQCAQCIGHEVSYKFRGIQSQLYRLSRLFVERPAHVTKQLVFGSIAHICTVTGVLVLIWAVVLYRGESRTFASSIAACDWSQWERWVRDQS